MDQGPVVLVSDLAGPVVELKLLQLRKDAIALLGGRGLYVGRKHRLGGRLLAEERKGDEDDDGGRQRGCEHELDAHVRATARVPSYRSASRRCSRASGQSAMTDPSRNSTPASQMRLTRGLTQAWR